MTRAWLDRMRQRESMMRKIEKSLLCCLLGFFIFAWVDGAGAEEELAGMYPGYPVEFDVQGIIDSKGRERLVVNDCTFALGTETVFHTPSGIAGIGSFPVGSRVGLLLAADRHVRSVWLLGPATSGQRSQDPPHQENGVWRN